MAVGNAVKPRRRRSSEEVRSLVLAAARELFAERGFGGTTTREIADRAGVSETVLFRNYGTKERIFQAAVVQPIDDFLRTYTAGWLDIPLGEGDPDEMLRNFVESLYDLARGNRSLLLAAASEELGREGQTAFARLEHMAAEIARAHGYSYDAPVAVRVAVAMVVSIAVFHEALFGPASAADRDRVVAEVTGILTRGLER
jgi:AcrR family transcriptional regulator